MQAVQRQFRAVDKQGIKSKLNHSRYDGKTETSSNESSPSSDRISKKFSFFSWQY